MGAMTGTMALLGVSITIMSMVFMVRDSIARGYDPNIISPTIRIITGLLAISPMLIVFLTIHDPVTIWYVITMMHMAFLQVVGIMIYEMELQWAYIHSSHSSC